MRIGLALNCRVAPWSRFAQEELLLPGHAEELPDLAVRRADLRRRLDRRGHRHPRGPADLPGRDRARPHGGGHRQVAARRRARPGRIHGADYSAVDYNRAGIPLIEIVTRPITGTGRYAPQVARAYVTALRDLLRTLGVSDVRMEQGSMRCDVNLSLRASPDAPLGTRSETKNVNSLRSVERAVTLRDTPPRRRARRRSSAWCRRRATSTRTPRPPRPGGRSPTPRTTATSPSPTWCRSHPMRRGSSRCGPACPSCRRLAASGCRRSGGSPTSTCSPW